MKLVPFSRGLCHVAVFAKNFEKCVKFYTEILGMKIDWQPDIDNVYMSTGNDNFALHRAPSDFVASKYQFLDHIGFVVGEAEQVDLWYQRLIEHQVKVVGKPKKHRDGSRSFYCGDPDGRNVQILFHPQLTGGVR